MTEIAQRVFKYEFGDLMSMDRLIPPNLPERFSDLIFEDAQMSAYFLQWADKKPGTEIHDHGQSDGCVIVLKGCVRETVYTLDGALYERCLEPGKMVGFDKKYIHKFEDSTGNKESLSLHFYDPPLLWMNYYKEIKEGKLIQSGSWREVIPPMFR